MPSARPGSEGTETRCAIAAMGTVVALRASGGAAPEAAREAMAEIDRLEALWSRFRPGSQVSQLNAAGGGWRQVGTETAELLTLALRMGELTEGAFSVTAGSPGRLEHRGDDWFRLVDGARLDLGGIGKGAAADHVLRLLRDRGVTSGVVSFGQSSVGLFGTPRAGVWRVGVRAPGSETGRLAATLEVAGGSLSTSSAGVPASGGPVFTPDGTAPIVDPRTGRPAASDVRSATVLTPRGAQAEALSTALVVLGAARSLALHAALPSFEALLVEPDGTLVPTPGIAN